MIVLAGLLVLSFLFYASYNIRSGIYVKAFCEAKTTDKIVAITYDDGPHAENTEKILNVLSKHDAVATFFSCGNNASKHPRLVREIARRGHLIGNHSFVHTPWFPLMSRKRMKADLLKASETLESLSGQKITYFRPPFGVTNPTIKHVVTALDYQVIGWNIRSFDTRGASINKLYARVTKQIRPGSIILLHDHAADSDLLLERILCYVKENGYKTVRIDEMIKRGN